MFCRLALVVARYPEDEFDVFMGCAVCLYLYVYLRVTMFVYLYVC